MTDTAISAPPLGNRLPTKAKPKQTRVRISPMATKAVHAMVWLGMKRADAAEYAGMKDQSLYVALRQPAVKALYAQECEVLRLSGRARRIHRLEEMVEQDDNKAAVINAALALERLGETEETSTRRGAAAMPGFTIQLIQHVTGAPAPVTIEHKADE